MSQNNNLKSQEIINLVQLKSLNESYNILMLEVIKRQSEGEDIKQQPKNNRRTMGKPRSSRRY